MIQIEVVGYVAEKKTVYELRKPFLSQDFWQIFVDGSYRGSITKYGKDWESRVNPVVWIGEFEVLTFIEMIRNAESKKIC